MDTVGICDFDWLRSNVAMIADVVIDGIFMKLYKFSNICYLNCNIHHVSN